MQMQTSPHLSREGLQAAHERLAGKVRRTPVFHCAGLDEISGARLLFKCENFQKVGAFKFRGAMHALDVLSPEERARGVLTHSSGNHAQALALAARLHGVPAWIVMPENAPAVKRQAVEGYGAEVVPCAPTLSAREAAAAEVQARTGATFIHPYNDPRIIAGQATACLELLEDVDPPDLILAPVGGGGLLSGTALAAHHFAPNIPVYGTEPALADDAFQSLQSGSLQPPRTPASIADGLLTALGDWTFPIIREHVTGILTVREDSIIKALRLIFERMKIVVEPSGAVPLAAVLEHPAFFRDKRVAIIISGGNVDLAKLAEWFKA